MSFNTLCGEFVNLAKNNVIVGNFYIDVSKSTKYSNKLITTMQDHGLHKKVGFHTRITSSLRTTIDLLFTNDPLIRCKQLPSEIVSDHESILITKRIKEPRRHEDVPSRSIISWTNYSQYNLQTLLQRVNWSHYPDFDIEKS